MMNETMPRAKTVGRIVFCLFVIFATPASAADYVDAWGPAVATTLPLLEAYDHEGQLRTLENLVGERGLLLSLNRSADW